jgi:hypothetical protein
MFCVAATRPARAEAGYRHGEVRGYADLTRLGHVSRARLSQIMDLLLLAPDIQEEILFLPTVEAGYDPISERQLRGIVNVLDWGKQRRILIAQAVAEKRRNENESGCD